MLNDIINQSINAFRYQIIRRSGCRRLCPNEIKAIDTNRLKVVSVFMIPCLIGRKKASRMVYSISDPALDFLVRSSH